MTRFLIPVIVLTLLSCNKKENTPKSYSIYGEFARGRGITNDTSETVQYAGAVFFKDRQTYKITDVKKVLVNNVVLGEEGGDYQKTSMEAPELDLKNGAKWEVTGKGDIPSFEYEDNRVYPQLVGIIPDTMVISDGLIFKLKALNADSVQITVQHYLGGNGLMRRFSSHDDEFIFPQDLTSLIFKSGDRVDIEIFLISKEEKIFDDKKFIFYTTNRYRKRCLLW